MNFQKRQLALFLVLGLTTTRVPFAQAEANGGGYLGPNLSTQSVPVRLDRGIRSPDLGRALNNCLIGSEETTKAGRISLYQRLMGSIFVGTVLEGTKIYPAVKASYVEGDKDQFIKHQTHTVHLGYQLRGFSYARWVYEATGDAPDFYSKYPKVYQMSFHLERSAKKTPLLLDPDLRVVLVSVNGNIVLGLPDFPMIHFDSGTPAYDADGQEIPDRYTYQGIKIVLPPTYGVAVPLINLSTGKQTKRTVNLVEYVQCLQSEIQKLQIKASKTGAEDEDSNWNGPYRFESNRSSGGMQPN